MPPKRGPQSQKTTASPVKRPRLKADDTGAKVTTTTQATKSPGRPKRRKSEKAQPQQGAPGHNNKAGKLTEDGDESPSAAYVRPGRTIDGGKRVKIKSSKGRSARDIRAEQRAHALENPTDGKDAGSEGVDAKARQAIQAVETLDENIDAEGEIVDEEQWSQGGNIQVEIPKLGTAKTPPLSGYTGSELGIDGFPMSAAEARYRAFIARQRRVQEALNLPTPHPRTAGLFTPSTDENYDDEVYDAFPFGQGQSRSSWQSSSSSSSSSFSSSEDELNREAGNENGAQGNNNGLSDNDNDDDKNENGAWDRAAQEAADPWQAHKNKILDREVQRIGRALNFVIRAKMMRGLEIGSLSLPELAAIDPEEWARLPATPKNAAELMVHRILRLPVSEVSVLSKRTTALLDDLATLGITI
ncbi:hypothetical protein F4777DRAFT_372920 [Nemania sp. FL0916]|nr:hypothetical protein F4777DRAFT_372920 [Nemania sp. FL0916]